MDRNSQRPLRRYMQPPKSDDITRARAEAAFKERDQQKADAPAAMAEYRAAQQAALDRMHELRRLRLAREAQGERPSLEPRRRGRPKKTPMPP